MTTVRLITLLDLLICHPALDILVAPGRGNSLIVDTVIWAASAIILPAPGKHTVSFPLCCLTMRPLPRLLGSSCGECCVRNGGILGSDALAYLAGKSKDPLVPSIDQASRTAESHHYRIEHKPLFSPLLGGRTSRAMYGGGASRAAGRSHSPSGNLWRPLEWLLPRRSTLESHWPRCTMTSSSIGI